VAHSTHATPARSRRLTSGAPAVAGGRSAQPLSAARVGTRANAEPVFRQSRHVHLHGQRASRQRFVAQLRAVQELARRCDVQRPELRPPEAHAGGLVTGNAMTRSTSPDRA
jgi:hypothetical protein